MAEERRQCAAERQAHGHAERQAIPVIIYTIIAIIYRYTPLYTMAKQGEPCDTVPCLWVCRPPHQRPAKGRAARQAGPPADHGTMAYSLLARRPGRRTGRRTIEWPIQL